MVKDCIIDDEHGKVTFVVKNGDMGLAIGKGGSSVSKVQRAVDKGIEIVELDDDPIQFIKNCLSPAKLQSVKISQKQSGEKIAIVTADNTNKRIIFYYLPVATKLFVFCIDKISHLIDFFC